MATIDVAGFAAAAEAVALRIDSQRLPGLLTKRLVVPRGAVACLRDEGGREAMYRAGAEASGKFSGVLVKEGDFAVPFQIGALATREGMTVTAGVEVVMRVPPRSIELRELLDTLLRDRDRVDAADLRGYLTPSVRLSLSLHVAHRSAEDLAHEDPRPALEANLREQLKAPCFVAGLELLECRHPSFSCVEYDKERRHKLDARAQEAELAARERLQEYAARLEKNDALKKQEVEDLAKVLQYEGVLKEVSLRNEVDRKRKEEDVRRFETLSQKLGHDDVKALIFLLEDEKLKADLITKLIERDMTEEQLRARQVVDLERRLDERLAELSQKMAAVVDGRTARLGARGTTARRVLGVHGKQVLAFDPRSGSHRSTPSEVYDFTDGPFGFLRSVRTVVTRDGPIICAGAQRGVYVAREGLSGGVAGVPVHRDVRQLRLPRDPQGQGGVNSIAYFDGHFYATHSECGLFRWDAYLIARPEPLYASVTARNDSTRGAMIGADGKLFFASGPDLFRADLVRPDQPLTAFRGGALGEGPSVGGGNRDEDSITSFHATDQELFAGMRSGRILRWSQSDPATPRELHVRKAEPIYMLKVAELNGDPHLLLGAKEHGLTAVSLEDGRAFDFRAQDQIRWVDGASDYVFGVSRDGYAIHVFEATRTDREAHVLRVSDKLQDIWVQKERSAPAAGGGGVSC